MQSPVQADRDIRNLALVGFMGVGKSTVGRLVAEELRFRHVDTDELIEQQAGMKIGQIFEHCGEHAFREIESHLVDEMEKWSGTVISTGGGLIVQPGHLESLRRHAFIVCLWASPDTIYQRTQHQTHRPLLQTGNPRERIRELLAQREPFYKRADVLISTELRPARELASHIAHHFRGAQQTCATR